MWVYVLLGSSVSVRKHLHGWSVWTVRRADRVIELSRAFDEEDFDAFDRKRVPKVATSPDTTGSSNPLNHKACRCRLLSSHLHLLMMWHFCTYVLPTPFRCMARMCSVRSLQVTNCEISPPTGQICRNDDVRQRTGHPTPLSGASPPRPSRAHPQPYP